MLIQGTQLGGKKPQNLVVSEDTKSQIRKKLAGQKANPATKPMPQVLLDKTLPDKAKQAEYRKNESPQIEQNKKIPVKARQVKIKTEYGVSEVDHEGQLSQEDYKRYQEAIRKWAKENGMKPKAGAPNPDMTKQAPVDVASETKRIMGGVEAAMLGANNPMYRKADEIVQGAIKANEGEDNKYLKLAKDLGLGIAESYLRPATGFETAVGNIYDPTATGEEKLGAIGNAALLGASVLPAARGVIQGVNAAGKLGVKAGIQSGVKTAVKEAGLGKLVEDLPINDLKPAAVRQDVNFRPEHQELAKKLGLDNPVEQAVRMEPPPHAVKPAWEQKMADAWREKLNQAAKDLPPVNEHTDPRIREFQNQLYGSPDYANPNVYVPGKSAKDVTQSVWVELQPDAYKAGRAEAHKELIERALASKEPIHPDILRDYPDLIKKYVKTDQPKEVPTIQKSVQQPVQVPEGTPATSARKVMVAEDRANMGLGELEDPLRKTWGEALDNARNRGFNDAWAEREAKSVIEKPRAFSDEETAGMTEAMARRKVEFKSVRNQLANATDPAEIEKLSNDLAGIQKQYDTLSEAVGLSGTEKGRALASQKLTLSEDYDLISIKSEAKASKKADLTDKENAMFDDMVKRLEVAEARIAEVEMKNLDLQAMVDSMPKGAKSGRRIARTSVEIKAARADALERIKASKPTAMYSGLAPLGDIDYKAIAQYALTFVEEGVGKVEDVINLTLKGAKEAGIDLSEQEVRKALIDWGTPKKSTRELDAAIFQRDRLRKEIRQSIADLGESTFERIRKEATALPRALQATGDLSATLRQGLILGAGNKRKALAAFGKAMKAVVDPVYSAKLERELMSSPMAVVRKQAKLYIADGETMSLAEEAFMSRIAKEYPILKTITGASERHYTTFLNQLRASVFDDMVARFPEMTMQDKTALADFINVATGRGRVAHGLSEKASKVFFSPRFMASRIEAPLDAVGLTKEGRAMWKSPGARHQLMKSWSTLIAGGGTLLGLAKLAGGEVSLDPDSPDFGKARFGDTSFDIWGGMQSPVRLLAKIAKQVKSGEKAKFGKDTAEAIYKFVRYKAAPMPNIILGAIDKQDAVGQPYLIDKNGKMTVATVGEDIGKSFSPLLIKDLASLWNLDGETKTPIGAKVAGTVAAPLGVGVSTYKRKDKSR